MQLARWCGHGRFLWFWGGVVRFAHFSMAAAQGASLPKQGRNGAKPGFIARNRTQSRDTG
ncbi:hypothetical protein ARZXY2_2597 [Arthrobacter sp. ZXY-2]|nr:hypothetical protein ARZXY2_2597 [Arthrobacter sp. ZXY-2]